jgi:hypothetical protein
MSSNKIVEHTYIHVCMEGFSFSGILINVLKHEANVTAADNMTLNVYNIY